MSGIIFYLTWMIEIDNSRALITNNAWMIEIVFTQWIFESGNLKANLC
jgi:hypothetical protein